MLPKSLRSLFTIVFLVSVSVSSTFGQEDKAKTDKKEETTKVSIGQGVITMHATKKWEVIKPKVRFIEAEFAIKKSKGDENNGRLTMMGAGGSIKQNIDRWIGQFKSESGGSVADTAKVSKKEFDGHTVHYVDITGTYNDSRGPQAPAVQRKDYRMLAAIIETDQGNYFVKFYGPKKTVADNEKHFEKMMKSLKVAQPN